MSEDAIAAELAALEGAWQGSSPSMVKSNIPDADYVARFEKISITKSKKGALMAVTHTKVADGNLEGKDIMRFDMLDNEMHMAYFKAHCETLGVKYPESIAALPATLQEFTEKNTGKLLLNLTAKTNEKSGFQNIYVKSLVDYQA